MEAKHALQGLRNKVHTECWIWNPLTLFRSAHKSVKINWT